MKVNSITITYLSKVSFASLNGSDSDADNINTIKKITLEDNSELPYVSSQAIRRALRNQLESFGWKVSNIEPSKKEKAPAFTECDPVKYIDDDLFGYMKAQETGQKARTRTSPIRVESLVALSEYKADLDFSINLMGREKGADPNPFETEIHSGIYRGTVLIELDRIGCGSETEGFAKELANEEKVKRVYAFVDAFQNLWSSGRQTRFLADISPKFFAAALMKAKNPVFLETVNYPVDIESLNTVVSDYSDFIDEHVFAGQEAVFSDIKGEYVTLKDGFEKMKKWVKEYYGVKK